MQDALGGVELKQKFKVFSGLAASVEEPIAR
jgi:hypothetical protein